MDPARDIAAKTETVQQLLTEKFGVRKRDLPKMLRRTGRRLPRGMRARGQVLIKAQALAAHPKLARQVDGPAVARAFEEITAHLRAIDVADRRKGLALSVAGGVAFNILAVCVCFVLWLWWAGYL